MKDNTIKHKGYQLKYKTLNGLHNYTIEDENGRVINCGDSDSLECMNKDFIKYINNLIYNNIVEKYFIGISRKEDVELCVEYKDGRQQIVVGGVKPRNQSKIQELVDNANKGLLLDKFAHSVISMDVSTDVKGVSDILYGTYMLNRANIDILSYDIDTSVQLLKLIKGLQDERC